ncbi:response regulator [Granulicella paludicola]|jgi:two-component system chemotaxis response regulator CheY|uniref:response regulator n=1 Tax=Granulicella paludicola TaxID=474951 RepID=UPI0021E0935F|nr:response regulator [Granulicella paludicola]
MNILLVDDSKAMRLLVKRALREAGYGTGTVLEASNGEEALQIARQNVLDLLLSDWNMPGTTGIELLNQLRAIGSVVKFGFITSESAPEMRARAIAAGAQFMITKPFTSNDLKLALAGEFGQ